MLSKNEKEEEMSEKIDEAKLALEYMEKDKEKSKPNKNDFNKIVYVEYEDIFKNKNPEIDFLRHKKKANLQNRYILNYFPILYFLQ